MKKPAVLAICNQKGGVGKRIVSASLARFWAETLDVLLIGLDPQGSASQIFLSGIGPTIFEAVTGGTVTTTPALPQYPPRLRILPASPRLAALDAMMAAKLDRFHIAQDLLAKIDADIIICDCPGTMSLQTIAPLVATDFVLIPVSTDPMSFDQVSTMMQAVATVQRRLTPELRVLPLAVTLFDASNRLDHEVLAERRSRYAVFNTVVRRCVRIKEDFAARVHW